MLKTAITGGIGSGKSYVCNLLAERGINIYDCDAAAKRLMATSTLLRQQLTELIGPDTYLNNEPSAGHNMQQLHGMKVESEWWMVDSGRWKENRERSNEEGRRLKDEGTQQLFVLNKAAVAQFLLASEDNARAIDAIVHPAVAADFRHSGLQWMECAILYESGFDSLVDRVIVVTAPEEVRLKRIMHRDSISESKAREWIARQWPQEEVRRRADFEIVNDGKTPLLPQIEKILITI